MRAPPPIPDKPELFCSRCRMYRKRAMFSFARWSGPSGNQVVYICQSCMDKINKNKRAAR